MKKKLQKLDILLSIHSLQYVILKWHDHARKSKTTIFPFPYQKRIAGTKGAIAQKYGRDSSLIFDTIEKELEQIDLLLNYPHASESDLLAHARYEDGEISV